MNQPINIGWGDAQNPIDASWFNSLLWIIYRVEIPSLKEHLLKSATIVLQGTDSPQYDVALKELEHFGKRHLM